MASVYSINKGVNMPVTFKGLKAQYIGYLGGGIVCILIAFAILYISGVNTFVCLGITLAAGGGLFYRIYRLSHQYGEYGMLKKIGKRQVPKLIRSNSRKVFMKVSAQGTLPFSERKKNERNGKMVKRDYTHHGCGTRLHPIKTGGYFHCI